VFRPAKDAASGDVQARDEPAARGNCSGFAVTAGHLVSAGYDVLPGKIPSVGA